RRFQRTSRRSENLEVRSRRQSLFGPGDDGLVAAVYQVKRPKHFSDGIRVIEHHHVNDRQRSDGRQSELRVLSIRGVKTSQREAGVRKAYRIVQTVAADRVDVTGSPNARADVNHALRSCQ